MKSIKIKDYKEFYLDDKFYLLINLISVYFKRGGENTGSYEIKPYSFYVKPRMQFFQKYCTLKTSSAIIINDKFLKSISFNSSFFDKEENQFGIPIYVNGELIACYCQKYQIFALAPYNDINSPLKILPIIFKILKEKNLIKEMNFNIETKNLKKLNKIQLLIGSDPEFEELKNWNTYDVIPSTYHGKEESEIGSDYTINRNYDYLLELRPKAAKDPSGLVSNIKTLINRLDVPISVKGDVYGIGAHIHFGLSSEYNNYIPYFIEPLNDFLKKPLYNLNGRARYNADTYVYRRKLWGFEYMALPSAYLITPSFAYVTYKIAYNIVLKILQTGEITYNDKLTIQDYLNLGITKQEIKIFAISIKQYKLYRGLAINNYWK